MRNRRTFRRGNLSKELGKLLLIGSRIRTIVAVIQLNETNKLFKIVFLAINSPLRGVSLCLQWLEKARSCYFDRRDTTLSVLSPNEIGTGFDPVFNSRENSTERSL